MMVAPDKWLCAPCVGCILAVAVELTREKMFQGDLGTSDVNLMFVRLISDVPVSVKAMAFTMSPFAPLFHQHLDFPPRF
jgi:hypothetical protein